MVKPGKKATKYINKFGKEKTTFDFNLSNLDATEITQIGYHHNKDEFRIITFPKTIKKVPNKLPSIITSLEEAFKNNQNEKIEGIEDWDTSNITSMSNTFHNANSFNQDISNWKTNKVTTMRAMFYFANKFNHDISN